MQALREEHEAAVAAIKAAHTAELQQLDTKLDDVSARAMQVCLPVCLPVSVCVRRTNDCVTPGNKARLSTAIFLSPPVQTHTHTRTHTTHTPCMSMLQSTTTTTTISLAQLPQTEEGLRGQLTKASAELSSLHGRLHAAEEAVEAEVRAREAVQDKLAAMAKLKEDMRAVTSAFLRVCVSVCLCVCVSVCVCVCLCVSVAVCMCVYVFVFGWRGAFVCVHRSSPNRQASLLA